MKSGVQVTLLHWRVVTNSFAQVSQSMLKRNLRRKFQRTAPRSRLRQASHSRSRQICAGRAWVYRAVARNVKTKEQALKQIRRLDQASDSGKIQSEIGSAASTIRKRERPISACAARRTNAPQQPRFQRYLHRCAPQKQSRLRRPTARNSGRRLAWRGRSG